MNVPGVIASPSAEGRGNLITSFSSSPGFFGEFILSWGTFFDRLRMSEGKSQNERGKLV